MARIDQVADYNLPRPHESDPDYDLWVLDFRKARKARNPTRPGPQKGRVSSLRSKPTASFGL